MDASTFPSDDQLCHPAFMRGGVASPFGALMDELKTKVDFETAGAFRRIAAETGTDCSGAIREFVYWRVHGKTYSQFMAECAKDRANHLLKRGHEQAPFVAGVGS